MNNLICRRSRSCRLFAGMAVFLLSATAAASAAPGAAVSDARLASIFQDNMVLQRDIPARIWGWAPAGTAVEVDFAGQAKQAKADDKGYWKVTLDPLQASNQGRDLAVRIGETTITRHNILVGEVWVAAGQSNMVHAGPDKDTGVLPHYVSPAGAAKPEIRVIMSGTGASLSPLADADPMQRDASRWEKLAENPPEKEWNIARYFARLVRDKLEVPVGIVQVAVSGTNEAAWMSRETLQKFPAATGKGTFYDEFMAAKEEDLAKSKGPFHSWKEFQDAETQWRSNPKGTWPGRPMAMDLANFPSALYNTRIHPLAPLAFRGVIWHQGEAGPGGPYGERLVAMIRQWRELFGEDFYFIWGTLGRGTNVSPPLEPQMSWFYRSRTNVEITKALELFGDDKKVALVEFYDLGDDGTHFLQKAQAGRRMALAALTLAYGQHHLYTGPRVVDAKITGNKATLRFDHTGKGLVYQPSLDGISGVILKGKTGDFQWANINVVDGSTIEVSHPLIAEIETIAYGVAVNPHETIFNSDRLPASPYRHNTGAIPFKVTGTPMVRLLNAKDPKASFSLPHVRRDGYVFQLKSPAKESTIAVEAYIAGEWKDYEVRIGGQTVNARETSHDGRRFVTFDAPANETWIIVAAKGKAAEFEKVDRF